MCVLEIFYSKKDFVFLSNPLEKKKRNRLTEPHGITIIFPATNVKEEQPHYYDTTICMYPSHYSVQ